MGRKFFVYLCPRWGSLHLELNAFQAPPLLWQITNWDYYMDNNYIHICGTWLVPCSFVKPPWKLGHGWVITSHPKENRSDSAFSDTTPHIFVPGFPLSTTIQCMGHVTLAVIAGTTVVLPYHVVKSLQHIWSMMTSSNRNIFRVTDPLSGEFTGHRWIPLTKASDAELWCLFDLRLG